MTPEQKQSTSEKQQAHWDRCRALAKVCDVRPGEINMAWSSIKGFVEDTEKISALILKRRSEKQRQTREHYRNEHNSARKREKPKNLTQAVRIMVWAIDTIDDLDLAKRAFDKAYVAVEEEKQ